MTIRFLDGEVAEPDAVLAIQFLGPERGGRVKRVGGPAKWEYYACPLFVPSVAHGFDARIYSETAYWEFDQPYEVDAIFLDAKEARKFFLEGTKFTMWEGRTIGHGSVKSALWQWADRAR